MGPPNDATPLSAVPARPSFAGRVCGWLALGLFVLFLACYAGGFVGGRHDPQKNVQWGGLYYVLLIAVPVRFVCPVGLLLGLAGILKGSRLSWVAFLLHAVALIRFSMWVGHHPRSLNWLFSNH